MTQIRGDQLVIGDITTDTAMTSAFIVVGEKAAANGVATLDASSLIPSAQIPALAITSTSVVADQTARLALTAQVGDVAVQQDVSQSFILQTEPATANGNWVQLLTQASAVLSVNTQTGSVVLTTSDITEGTNLYYTEGRVTANTTVAANAVHVASAANPHSTSVANLTDTVITSPANTEVLTYSAGNWINQAPATTTPTSIVNAGNNTKIQVEETLAENIIRFDVGATTNGNPKSNALVFDATQFTLGFSTAAGGTNIPGSTVNLTAGRGLGSSIGGVINLTGGQGGLTGPGGDIILTGGQGDGAGGSGGAITLQGGPTTNDGQEGGAVNILGGQSSSSGLGGVITITGGAAGNSGSIGHGGDVLITGGASTVFNGLNSGNVFLRGGTSGASGGDGGQVTIAGGSPRSGYVSGGVSITGGDSPGNVKPTVVSITGGSVTGGGQQQGGNIDITGGTSGGTSNLGGAVVVRGGPGGGTNAPGGNIELRGGIPTGSGAVGEVAFYTGSSQRMRLENDGAVSIFTTTTPGVTTNKMYNTGGNLFWNGVQLDTTGGTLSGLTDTTITAAAKGDLLVHNNTAWVDVGVGANDDVLTADSATASGVKWAAAVAATPTSIVNVGNNTRIQVEETLAENIIRFDVGAITNHPTRQDVLKLDSSQFTLSFGGSSTGAAAAINLTSGRGGGSAKGGNITLTGGLGGFTDGTGGDIMLIGGPSDNDGIAGDVIINGGVNAGGSTDYGAGGNVNITGGAASVNGTTGDAGDVIISGGVSSTAGNLSGIVNVHGGNSNTVNGGDMIISGGNTTATGQVAGKVTITGGNSNTTTPGKVSILGGTPSGQNSGGAIDIIAGTGNVLNVGGAVTIKGGVGGSSGNGGNLNLHAGLIGGGSTNGRIILYTGNTAVMKIENDGTITIEPTTPATTFRKLYNVSDNLFWNGIQLDVPPVTAINNQTASYTLALTDLNKFVTMNVGSANILTIDANATVAFAIGSVIKVNMLGTGVTSIAITTDTVNGVTNGTVTALTQYQVATLTKIATTVWNMTVA